MLQKIKCFFGFHDWINLTKYNPVLKPGQWMLLSDLHECAYCNKQEWKSMGFYS